MAEMKKQPSDELQALYDAVLNEEPETVEVLGKKYRIGWLHNYTMRRFSSISLKEKDLGKLAAKLAAVVMLNTRIRIKLLYSIWWRWIYYVKDPDPAVLLAVINAGKKKFPAQIFSLIIMYSTAMRDTWAAMTKTERKSYQAARDGEAHTH